MPAPSHRGTRNWAARLALPVLLGVAVLFEAGAPLAQDRPAKVGAERVELRRVTDTTPILAELVATTQSEVATRTEGIVDEVVFQVGDRVERGALMVRLDRDLVDIQRRNAAAAEEASRAGVAVAETQVQLAMQAFERQRNLRGSAAFSRGQFEDLEVNVAQAQSELARAQAQVAVASALLARAEYDQRHIEIRAPFAGIVIAKQAQPGAYIDLGEPVATLLDVNALEIEANMPVTLLNGLRPGMIIEATMDGGKGRLDIQAELRSVLPIETATTRTRPVRFSVDHGQLDGVVLAAGKSVTLQVPVSAPREALTVPKDALVQARGGWRVFTVEEGQASPKTITIGQPVGDRMEVLSGLLPGDVVVVRGNERLRPGQPVEAVIATPDADADGRAGEAAAPAGTRKG
ncbi:MAG: efflux RND transporter periplasmic adaptor subunit [Pikeienuella sp.]